ncbi:MAG: RCC1 repeat-containing protein, partial [Deltaproteobacteria bacterium]|nr:RCC1 repeat-containing protein [Deltaproteobacteria bacterium]
CWGLNSSGQLGNSSSINAYKPVAVTGVSTAAQAAAGGRHSCALLSDGTLKCWGLNIFGQLGNSSFLNASAPVTVTGITTASGIASGSNHACSSLTDGTVRCWGDNSAGQLGILWPLVGAFYMTTSSSPVQVSLTSVVGMAAGLYHSCARLSDNRVVC